MAPRRSQDGGLAAQVRVVYALILREMQMRFGQSRVGYLWLVAEPGMLALGVSSIHWLTGSHLPNDIPTFMFYGLGYAPFFMFRGIVTRNAGAIHSGLPLLYHRAIRLHDLTLSRSILEMVVCTAVVALFVLGGIIVADVWPKQPGLFVLTLLLSALLAHGFGTLIAVITVFWEPLERVVHPLTYLMLPFSAAFSMLESLPQGAREGLLWNPLVHVNEALRDAQWGNLIVSYYNIGYVLLWILMLNLLAIAGLRAARPYLSLSG